MDGVKSGFLLPFYGLLLLGNNLAESTSPSPTCSPGQCSTSGEMSAVAMVTTPQVDRAMIQKCNSSMDDYCFHGECMFLLDLNEYHCRCERDYSGHRCAHLALVIQPLSQESLIFTVICVTLAVVGIAGTAYFLYRWYKKSKHTPGEKPYQEVQMV